MNRFAIRLLDPKKHDSVLEIGFGNGKYIREIARTAGNGLVAGVDYSQTMVSQARKRNRKWIRQGKVEIHCGSADRLPFESDTFQKVFTVNTIYFWPHPDKEIAEIYRVLKPGGSCVISFRSKEKMERLPFAGDGFRLFEPDEVVRLVTDAGFKEVLLESMPDQALDVNCVMAIK